MDKQTFEYIWLDGYEVENLRSKIKVVESYNIKTLKETEGETPRIKDVPKWGFDGSSTKQAKGSNSDCILKPVYICKNPRGLGVADFLVLCGVFTPDGKPHPSNYRALLKELEELYKSQKMWFALEQEYFICNTKTDGRPYQWPEGFPSPQGRYYCGVGGDVAWGRSISEQHLKDCLSVGLPLSGTNAEVAPAQWEYQIGPGSPTELADQIWVSRFILNKIAERYNANIDLSPKPIMGDWNGSGAHINFSTKEIRENCPQSLIEDICTALQSQHLEHLKVYGINNLDRLTGDHETCSFNEFKWGNCDRTASIRIPACTVKDGKGYLEDRRPAANVNPYRAFAALMKTICSGKLLISK